MTSFLLNAVLLVQEPVTDFWHKSSDDVPFWVTIITQIIVGGVIIAFLQQLFNNNLEKYRALLSHNSQFQLSWKNEEREALVNLHSKIFDHYYFLTGQMENAFVYDSYKEMVSRIETINNSTTEKNKAYEHYTLFASDQKIKALVTAYNVRSGKYTADLTAFMYACFEIQCFEIVDGLATHKRVLNVKEWNDLGTFKDGIRDFINNYTVLFMNDAEPILQELSNEIQKKIKSIEF
ncbi:hypothetical protein [Sphingobacterium siyangense]|uniref:hypothetical protein n=1 Tax=Sphingobacterium siyangense TaxID=459529 RepID=UPI002FDCE839